jgi:hypothetical protein
MNLPETVTLSLETLVIGGVMLLSLGAWIVHFVEGDLERDTNMGILLLLLPGLIGGFALAVGAVWVVIGAVIAWPWLLLALPVLAALGHFLPDRDDADALGSDGNDGVPL